MLRAGSEQLGQNAVIPGLLPGVTFRLAQGSIQLCAEVMRVERIKRHGHQQLHGILGHALGALPAEQREVVRRRYYRGQTVAEIATATGVPEKEVRKLEAAALRALRHPRISRGLRAYM